MVYCASGIPFMPLLKIKSDTTDPLNPVGRTRFARDPQLRREARARRAERPCAEARWNSQFAVVAYVVVD